MVCVDCKGTRHKDRYSGYCPWNSSNFTLPVEERTPDNPKIRRPTSGSNSGNQPQRNNRYADNCAATVNQVIDRILHNQDGNDRDRQESAIQDASSWSEEDRRDFTQYKKTRRIHRPTGFVKSTSKQSPIIYRIPSKFWDRPKQHFTEKQKTSTQEIQHTQEKPTKPMEKTSTKTWQIWPGARRKDTQRKQKR